MLKPHDIVTLLVVDYKNNRYYPILCKKQDLIEHLKNPQNPTSAFYRFILNMSNHRLFEVVPAEVLPATNSIHSDDYQYIWKSIGLDGKITYSYKLIPFCRFGHQDIYWYAPYKLFEEVAEDKKQCYTIERLVTKTYIQELKISASRTPEEALNKIVDLPLDSSSEHILNAKFKSESEKVIRTDISDEQGNFLFSVYPNQRIATLNR